MAYDIRIFDYTLKSTNDLGSDQFRAVKVDAANDKSCVLASVAAERVVGVLQNNPGAGQSASVRKHGISKYVAGGVIAANDPLTTDNQGRLVKSTVATDFIAGVALEAVSGAGVIGTALLF